MVIYNINLDLVKENYTTFKVKQNDDIALKFNIFNNSLTEDMTGAKVILNALKSDNTFVKQTENIAIANNTITVNCLRDITRVGGILKLELVILKDNKQKTTFEININVVNSVIAANAEASKNVVSVIEILDNKIAQGKEIVAEVDKTKIEAIDTVTKLKQDTITALSTIKEETITQLNATTEDVKNLKKSTLEEATKIKTDSIAELEKIKADSIKELTSIKDTANVDLDNTKKDTIAAVTKVAQEAIDSINKYNIQDVSKKLDEHIKDTNLHVTKELKDSIATTAKDIENLKQEFKDNVLTSFKTDVQMTNLKDCNGGFVNVEKVQGQTLVNLFKIKQTLFNSTYNMFISENEIKTLSSAKTITISNTTTRKIYYDVYVGVDKITQNGFINAGAFKILTLNSTEVLNDIVGKPEDGWNDTNKTELKALVLEGEYTNKPIPGYFEGIKSVGEPIEVGSNLINIMASNIITTGIYNRSTPEFANIFLNNDVFIGISVDGYYKSDNCTLISRDSQTIKFNVTGQLAYGVGFKAKVKPNARYKLVNSSDGVGCFDEKGYPISYLRYQGEFITPSNCAYVLVVVYGNSGENTRTNIQLKECAYRIEILSRGGNQLFDKSTGIVKGKYLNLNGQEIADDLYWYDSKYYNVKSLSKISTSHNFGVNYYDDNKNLLKWTNGGNNLDLTNVTFVRFSDKLINLDSYMVNEGDTVKQYESYKGDKTEILTTQPLRQWDSIDSNGVINRGSGQVVLSDGNWYEVYTNPNTKAFALDININQKANYDGKSINNMGWIYEYTTTDKEHVYFEGNKVIIFINKSRLTTQDVSGFKTWISSNNITMTYKLATPTTENTNKTLNLRGYDNLIVNSGAVQPTVSYSYAKNVGERITSIEDGLENIIDEVDSLRESEEVTLTPLNGFGNYMTHSFARRIGNVVTLQLYIDPKNVTFPFTQYQTIFILPSNFIPKRYIDYFYIVTNKGNICLSIKPNGEVILGGSETMPNVKPDWINGTITYVI